jgi:adenine-specific DNA-methyltransferase
MDLFYFFIHLGIAKLKPGGILSYITTNYWITKSKKTGIKLLKPHILDKCFLIQYIDLSRIRVFRDALGQHNCIFTLQKKTENDKLKKSNRKIEVVQISSSKPQNQFNNNANNVIFDTLNHSLKHSLNHNFVTRYQSALTNRELNSKGSWNLLYPIEVKNIVDKIKSFCIVKGKTTFLKDYFIIRNGLILIKDEIFVLNPNENLKLRDNEVFVKINGEFVKLSEEEKKRLKKIYKSRSIRSYGYKMEDFHGYIIYFNKEEFKNRDKNKRNELLKKKYPVLTSYLHQYKEELEKILTNAKENVKDLYFPRRGSFIIRNGIDNKRSIVNLELLYDKNQKIFFKYISKENIFGYSEDVYYATSDTYFLWPKDDETKVDYLFFIAYLNSKLVNFLFKAKNISIKRSKTKLEDQLCVPNLQIFQSDEEVSKISLIKLLAMWMIQFTNFEEPHNLKEIKERILELGLFSKDRNRTLLNEIFESTEQNNQQLVQEIIDKLLFELFDLEEKEIDLLIEKYY